MSGNIYRDALDVQDACNPAGVAALYVSVLAEFHKNVCYTGTTSIKDNAALRLIAFKLADLHRVASVGDTVEHAYETCKRLAESEPVT